MNSILRMQSQFGKGSLFELNIPASNEKHQSALQAGSVASLHKSFFEAQNEILTAKTVKLPAALQKRVGWQIVLVDDDADCVNSLARILSAEGIEVIKAYSAADAISILNFASVDFVLCDASMPDGGAKRVLQYLGSKEEDVPPLIILSGHDDQAMRSQFIALGAADLWSKPLDLEKFRSGCARILLQRQIVKVA